MIEMSAERSYWEIAQENQLSGNVSACTQLRKQYGAKTGKNGHALSCHTSKKKCGLCCAMLMFQIGRHSTEERARMCSTCDAPCALVKNFVEEVLA